MCDVIKQIRELEVSFGIQTPVSKENPKMSFTRNSKRCKVRFQPYLGWYFSRITSRADVWWASSDRIWQVQAGVRCVIWRETRSGQNSWSCFTVSVVYLRPGASAAIHLAHPTTRLTHLYRPTHAMFRNNENIYFSTIVNTHIRLPQLFLGLHCFHKDNDIHISRLPRLGRIYMHFWCDTTIYSPPNDLNQNSYVTNDTYSKVGK